MAEVICDSKTFTVKLLTLIDVLKPRVQITDYTRSAQEGQYIEVTFRVWNDGIETFELEELDIRDDIGVIEKASWVGLVTSPNVKPGEYYEKTLSTYGLSRDMPDHDWVITVKACVRKKGLA